MPKVQSYADLYVAQMLVDELLRAGIRARLSNTDLVGMVPGVPFTAAYCEVWVDDPEMVGDAAQVVERFDKQRNEQPESVFDEEPVQRVRPTPVSLRNVALWMAAAALPGAAVYFLGLYVVGAAMAALGGALACIATTGARADYCSRCRSPLPVGAARCDRCRSPIEGVVQQQEHEQRGGMTRTVKGLGVGMLMLFVTLLAISWCTQAPEDLRRVPHRASGRPF